jgi:hypothetical protein
MSGIIVQPVRGSEIRSKTTSLCETIRGDCLLRPTTATGRRMDQAEAPRLPTMCGVRKMLACRQELPGSLVALHGARAMEYQVFVTRSAIRLGKVVTIGWPDTSCQQRTLTDFSGSSLGYPSDYIGFNTSRLCRYGSDTYPTPSQR